MKTGSWKIVVVVAGIAIGIWAGLSAQARRRRSKPIVIGGSLPLTGQSADSRVDRTGNEILGREEINAKGGLLGRKVEFKIYDDESDTMKAVTFAEKAITVDKVDLLFGGYPGTAARAVMPLAEKYKYVYVSMGGHMKSFEQGYTYSFGAPPLMGEWWYVGFFQWLATVPADPATETRGRFHHE